MKAFVACIALALVSVHAEPPSGYNYNRPSSGGFSGGFSGGLSGGGGYRAVSSGFQTSEGQNVDPQLLEQVRQILLKEESQSSSGSGFGGGFGGHSSGPSSSYGAPAPFSSYGAPAPSSSYGAPSTSYGAPSARVVGIDLEGVRQAIQVAQFEQSGGSSGGYPSGPSSSYGAPARAPSSSYGAPF
ncbi:pro-resilin [Amyelois transitella]|uniref:pro-resilin n=1 Tax=Amyelois transitella TaxID=680683 RepID=UPI00067C6800|nr:pro-resilin [Amyelois transitella]